MATFHTHALLATTVGSVTRESDCGPVGRPLVGPWRPRTNSPHFLVHSPKKTGWRGYTQIRLNINKPSLNCRLVVSVLKTSCSTPLTSRPINLSTTPPHFADWMPMLVVSCMLSTAFPATSDNSNSPPVLSVCISDGRKKSRCLTLVRGKLRAVDRFPCYC